MLLYLMAAMTTISVLVVDDHALIRAALVSVLNDTDDLRVIAEAANGADAVELAHKHSPAVVILDVDMPGVDAFHAASHILQLRPNTAIVFLTATDSDRAIEQALKAGARGFIVKSDDPSGIPGGVRAVAVVTSTFLHARLSACEATRAIFGSERSPARAGMPSLSESLRCCAMSDGATRRSRSLRCLASL